MKHFLQWNLVQLGNQQEMERSIKVKSLALKYEPCQGHCAKTNIFQPHWALILSPQPIPLFQNQYVLMDSHFSVGCCTLCHYRAGSVRGQLALRESDSLSWMHWHRPAIIVIVGNLSAPSPTRQLRVLGFLLIEDVFMKNGRV